MATPSNRNGNSQILAKVLIVDDEEDFLDIMAQRLRVRGIDVTGTTSAESALAMIAKEPYDVLIIDCMMPGMDGFKTLKTLKTHMSDVQVILHTAYIPEEKVAEALKLGALDVIEKPADLDLLTRMIFDAKQRKS
ncbi:MAG: response regulator [Desulfobacteraceae bacterium]